MRSSLGSFRNNEASCSSIARSIRKPKHPTVPHSRLNNRTTYADFDLSSGGPQNNVPFLHASWLFSSHGQDQHCAWQQEARHMASVRLVQPQCINRESFPVDGRSRSISMARSSSTPRMPEWPLLVAALIAWRQAGWNLSLRPLSYLLSVKRSKYPTLRVGGLANRVRKQYLQQILNCAMLDGFNTTQTEGCVTLER